MSSEGLHVPREKLSKKTAAGLVRISAGSLEQSDVLPYLMRL